MLPEHEWLAKAKRLAVGMRTRVLHRHEHRANMTIGNDKDRWWAYCQRCKEGGVVLKEHVLLNAPTACVQPPDLTLPTDMLPVLGSDYEEAVGRFLASKNMMYPYLPPLYYSEKVRRVLLHDGAHWHGRDLTGRSPAKWLHYGARFSGTPSACTVLTEDIFSMYKIRFALGTTDPCVPTVHDSISGGTSVCCTLGAGIRDSSVLALKNCSELVWAYDADQAGDDGYTKASKRMRAFGSKQFRARPPEGLDPKDMDCTSIRAMILGALNESRV